MLYLITSEVKCLITYCFSCYDSDDHSDCSESFKLGKSFREKYPRLCAKQGLKTPPFNIKSKKSTNVAKTPPSNHNMAHKQCYYEQEEQTNSKMVLGRSYSSDEYFKPKETVTISKDLWSQVQQCLLLMTSVFRQLNSESDNEKDSKNLSNERPSQRQSNLIRKSSVKQRLFNDANTSHSGVPQGLVVEKLFVRHKGSSTPGVELASRQTFTCDTKSKISEIESLDSGFCQENNNVSASTQQYSAPSSSSSRMGGSTSHNTIVSQKSEGSCGFMKSAAGFKQLSSGVSCRGSDSLRCLQPTPELLSPKVFGEHNQASSEKKRQRRYRLVRRRSASCKTRGRSTNETPTSDHESDTRENQHFARNELYPCMSTGTSEHESDTRESHHGARNEHSFDQCLSETDDFRIPEKTKMTAMKGIKQSECCSSPEIYDVMLVHAPPTLDSLVVHNKVLSPRAIPRNKTPSLTTSSQENCHSSTSHMHPRAISGNKRSQITELSQGYCRSSTPRKHLGVNNVATSPDSEAYLRRPLFQQNSGTSAESMPSPIRSTLNTNPTETMVNNTFLGNTDHPTLSSQPQNMKESLPSPISSKSPGAILQPEISVNFLRTKDILKRRSSCVTNEGPAKPNIPSGQNNDGYTKKLFPNLSKKGLSAGSNTLLFHIPSDDLFKQNTEQDYLSNEGHSKNNQRGNLMPSIVRSSNSTSTRSPDYCRSKSRNVLCATTDRRLVNSPLTQMHNSESSPTTESSTTRCDRKSKVTTPEKLNRLNHNSDRFTSPNNHQLKIAPRRAKFHPYATCSKFPRTPSLSSPFQSLSSRSPSLISPLRDLTIKSPSSPRHKWTTLDRSPMAVCVKQARRMSDPVVASRKILEFGSHGRCSDFSSDKEKSREERVSDEIKNEHGLQYPRKKFTMKRNNKVDRHVEDNESRSKCSNGKCTKTFCFNCSMMDLS
jgi:hypothetical protein